MIMKTMPAIFDCRRVAEHFRGWVLNEKASMGARLRLATVLYGPNRNAGSLKYRDLILKDAASLGLEHQDFEAGGEDELFKLLGRLNSDDSVTGVMVFYPIRGRLPDEDVMDLVSPSKDVEGLHSVNLGYLIKFKQFFDAERGVKCIVPATAKAVVKTLQQHDIAIERSFVTIINNSMRVGKPLALMLENLGATAVACYDKTRLSDLQDCVRRSDIVVTAVPDPDFKLDPDWVKPGAALLDVSFQGNFDPAAMTRAGWVTSAENRIGQVTRALTWVNLVYCARAARARAAASPA